MPQQQRVILGDDKMEGLLNLGSLIFGLIAWTLPTIILAKKASTQSQTMMIFLIGSLMSCLLALYLQIVFGNYLIRIEDWAALRDTTDAVKLVSGVLVLITIVFNISAFCLYNKKDY